MSSDGTPNVKATVTRTGLPVIHGRLSTYKRYGCRCDDCVQDYREKRRAWDATDAGRARVRRKDLKKKYGITPTDYEVMSNAQGGICALCDRPGSLPLVVDHDHETGRVRGLLCHPCNRSLGRWGDNAEGLRRVLAYLEASG